MTADVNILTDGSSVTHGDAAAINEAVARRIAELRKQRGLSLDQFARRSSVSKGMLVQIEQRRANPSVAILCRIAASLSISVADLVAVDDDLSSVKMVSEADAAVLWRGPSGGYAKLLIGTSGPDMFELWEWRLTPGERFEAQAHPVGTQELITVAEGSVHLEVDGKGYDIATGTSVSANTDRVHNYSNLSATPAVFLMAVFEPGGSR